jgi:Trk K+ transport system NAD-binding subunit
VREDVSGHVIITHYDPVATSLVRRLGYHRLTYVVTEPDATRALALHDQGVSVVVGEPDDAATYRKLRLDAARMVVATGDDYMNTNVAFTVRELHPTMPIVSFARASESVDVLELAGASHVLQLTEMLGRSLARRTIGGDVRANVIGRFGELLIVEAPVLGTPLVGKTVGEGWVRGHTGLTVVGVWKRGRFEMLQPDTIMDGSMVLVMAGSEQQVERFAELTAIYSISDAPVLILGGGRVGRAAGAALQEAGIRYVIVEKNPRMAAGENYVVGDAADMQVLERAGIDEAPTAMVTTSDDPTNVYLTIYCRRLWPDIQIISRATLEHNVSTLHRAGADFVMSYASMGANAVYNLLEQDDVVMVAEGLDVFRVKVPPRLVGSTLEQSGIRRATGCSVVAVGTTDAQREFIEKYFRGDGVNARARQA